MLADPTHRLLLVLTLVLILAGCGRSFPEQSVAAAARTTPAVQCARVNVSQATTASAAQYNERPQIQEPAWLAAARDDPDPNVRLDALETWAQNPGESLDPVTNALVDPDESVRTRAQELVERVWAAKAEAGGEVKAGKARNDGPPW